MTTQEYKFWLNAEELSMLRDATWMYQRRILEDVARIESANGGKISEPNREAINRARAFSMRMGRLITEAQEQR